MTRLGANASHLGGALQEISLRLSRLSRLFASARGGVKICRLAVDPLQEAADVGVLVERFDCAETAAYPCT